MTVRGVLLDVDGVLVVSWKPIPGAVDAIREVRVAGLPLAFLTNTTSRPRAEIASRLTDAGFAPNDDELITAGSATAAFLASRFPDARCLLLNDGPSDDFEGVDVARPGEPADVVVVGSAGPTFSWDLINAAARALLGGAELVAMHGTATWRTEEGICVDGASYVAALERATGRTASTIGKPAPQMFKEGLAHLGVPSGEVVMVGDDLVGDVLAAQAVGMRGVLVRTGKFRPDVLAGTAEEPDAVIDSIADLPRWLEIS